MNLLESHEHDTTAGSPNDLPVGRFKTTLLVLGDAVVDSSVSPYYIDLATEKPASPFFLVSERGDSTVFHSDRPLVDHVSERIDPAIARIRDLSLLEDDWDGEGNRSIPPEVIDLGIVFLRKAIRILSHPGNPLPPTPSVGPGPQGSLDIIWESTSFRVLVNLAETGKATYYGEDSLGATYKGSFRPEAPPAAILRLL